MRRPMLILAASLMLVVAACAAEETPVADGPATDDVAAGDSANGEDLYSGTCVACHGPDAMGLPNLGANLVGNEFVAQQSDDDLIAFLAVGRPADDPANLAGVAMPPKGGNPSLSDQDLADIAAYLRTLK